MSAGGHARYRPSVPSTKVTPPLITSSKGKEKVVDAPFEACAATASLFLYSQGSTVLCLHHDTLAIERKFHKHTENIQFISVDNVSERGAGRLVVTYDFGQTAIVWDLFSGEQVARFASYEPIRVAAWMRNGNIAFGNARGEVILFEPSTSEHISVRTIFDPITALAPSHDCKTYAIGYNNGSILLAGLTPTFTILHTLTTSRGPSPIATLTWHASSSKQKSDMLATQTSDGDLRVWSVAKPPASDIPRVIRVLKRSEEFLAGRNWIAWSKNGRIIQFSEGETWSWDVRTKHVTYEPIPTVEHVRGLASYGPTASLFTLGPGHTVQQYDLERPQMLASVQHIPTSLTATPESQRDAFLTSGSEDEITSPIGRATHEMSTIEAARAERNYTGSPRSNLSDLTTSTTSTSNAKDVYQLLASPGNQTASVTNFSLASMSATLRDSQATSPNQYIKADPKSPVSTRSYRKGSRLRQEVLPSPADKPMADLFPYTRARLSDVPYKQPRPLDESRCTPDDLRKQMLSVVFGWEEDIRDLIRDELSRHPAGSTNAALLSKWLDDDPDHMASMMSTADTPSSMDWMMLALSGFNKSSNKKTAQAFVQKMLKKGDIHAAATILLAVGERNEAIEIYVSQNRHMEAILLACLLSPQDWQRQSFLVRKWGEHVVENSQQQLAIRCFSCTGLESSEPWTSPIAQMAANFNDYKEYKSSQQSSQPSYTESNAMSLRRGMLEAPTPVAMPAPPTPLRQAAAMGTRVTAKTSALKLITSFGQVPGQFKFPGLKSDDRTPTNATSITPIAESAISRSALSPGGVGSYRMNNMRSLNSAMASANPSRAMHRPRLPSIGETPVDVTPPLFPAVTPRPLPTPADSGSEKDKDKSNEEKVKIRATQENQPTLILTSARYEPKNDSVKETPLTAFGPHTEDQFDINRPPSAPALMSESKGAEGSRSRNGSRSRKPEGLSIQMVPVHESRGNDGKDGNSMYGASLRRPSTAGSNPATYLDTQSELTSPPTTGNSTTRSQKSPSVSGRSMDQYISSLEQAQYYTKSHRSRAVGSLENQSKEDLREKKSRNRHRAPSDDGRGRKDRRHIPASKRSPSSPVPMSPEDLRLYTGSVESFDSIYMSQQSSTVDIPQMPQIHPKKPSSRRSESGNREKRGHRSRSRQSEARTKISSRGASGRATPDTVTEPAQRGRSKSKKDDSPDSPSSPQSMLPPSEADRQIGLDVDPALRLVSQNRERLQRSGSRRHERSTSARRNMSPDRRKAAGRSRSRQASDRGASLSRRSSLTGKSDRTKPRGHRSGSSSHAVDRDARVEAEAAGQYPSYAPSATPDPESRPPSIPPYSVDRRRKELAAAELEARRQSLVRRPSVPEIPLPSQFTTHGKSASVGMVPPQTSASPVVPSVSPFQKREAATRSPVSERNGFEASSRRKGHPGTPRAMPYPQHSQDPAIPDIPDNIETLLARNVYQPPVELGRSTSAPAVVPDETHGEIPLDLPKHPAFDHRIAGSRSSSKGREPFSPRGVSRDRNQSQERSRLPAIDDSTIAAGARDPSINTTTVVMPPLLPELQHLASPPPPPPPPAIPPQYISPITPLANLPFSYTTNGNGTNQPTTNGNTKLSLQTDFAQATQIQLPKSAYSEPSTSANPYLGHRRGRSGNGMNGMNGMNGVNGLSGMNGVPNENFMGKVRSIAERMRSSSRGKDNATKSPQQDNEATPSPYESIPPPSMMALKGAV